MRRGKNLPIRVRAASGTQASFPKSGGQTQEVALASRLVGIILLVLIAVSWVGCASIIPKRKVVEKSPAVVEEDLGEAGRSRLPTEQKPTGTAESSHPGAGQKGEDSYSSTPPPAIQELTPPTHGDLPPRSPRRIPWRDRKDGG